MYQVIIYNIRSFPILTYECLMIEFDLIIIITLLFIIFIIAYI